MRNRERKEEPAPPKRRELFRGQLDTQYTRLANNRFGITAGGIPRFLRYLPPDHLVGLAGAYDKNGKLKYLALSDEDQVLELQLDARDLETVYAKQKLDPEELNAFMSEVLTDLFVNSGHYFIAFDADRLAAGLYLDYGIRVKRWIHLQSLKQSKDIAPSTFRALYSLFREGGGGYTSSEKDRQEIEDAFNESCLEEKYYKRLSFRATSAYHMQKLWGTEIRDAIEMPLMIDTAVMTPPALSILGLASRASNLLDIRKPDYARNDFAEATFSPDFRTVYLELDRFQSRPRKQPGGSQIIILRVQDARGHKEVEATIREVTGRKAILDVLDETPLLAMRNPKVISIMTLGKDEPSGGEEQLREMILQRLLGRFKEDISVEHVPLVKLIWDESKRGGMQHIPRQTNMDGAKAITGKLNDSQARAVSALCAPEGAGWLHPVVQIVQGPPGSGKTTMIAAMVQWLAHERKDPIYLVTQSNTAVKNIAEKLENIGFKSYKLIVSREFKNDWHDHLYEKIKDRVVDTFTLPRSAQKTREMLGSIRVILCTVSMLAIPRLRSCGLVDRVAPPMTLIVDEASQIEISTYLVPFHFLKSLKRVCFVGDDKQLPPHGVEDLEGLRSIFEVGHLRKEALFLDVQYRMPVPIGEFLSREVYEGKLRSHHRIKSKGCLRFVDCANGEEDIANFSYINSEEIKATIKCCSQLRNYNYCVITAYDAQRNEIEKALKEEDLPWKDAVFNVDSFQVRNEADFIIVSVVRTERVGFLDDLRRTNVMLSRCKKAMVIVSKRAFLEGKGSETLVGLMATEFFDRWMTFDEVERGMPILDHDDLEGEDIPDDSIASMPSYTTRRDGRDKNWKPRVSGMTSTAGDSDWGQGGTPWDDDILAANSNTGARKEKEPSIFGDSDWGVGGQPWDLNSEPGQARTGWEDEDELPADQDEDEDENAGQLNEQVEDKPDDHDDEAVSDAGTETPGNRDRETDAPTSETAREPVPGPSASRFPEPVQFDWADEPQGEMTPLDFSSVPPGLNVNVNVGGVGTSSTDAAGGAGWAKKGKNKKGRPLRTAGNAGAPIPPSPAAGTKRPGKGKGKATRAQLDTPEPSRSQTTPTTPLPQQSSGSTPAARGKGKKAAVATLYADEVLEVHAEPSEWVDNAWDTTTAPTWDV